MSCTKCGSSSPFSIAQGTTRCQQCGFQIRGVPLSKTVSYPTEQARTNVKWNAKPEPRTTYKSIHWQAIPVFIINYNNLDRGFRRLLRWLRDAEMTDIRVIDNGSTYAPLLEFYASEKLHVIRNKENEGPWVLWDHEVHLHLETLYIASDPDVVPCEECPKNLVEKMVDVFENNIDITKIGPGIRTDNIPDYYKSKQKVIAHELPNTIERDGDTFKAGLDTTFALYAPKVPFTVPINHHHRRLAFPYLVEHIPWYEDSTNPTAESKFYKEQHKPGWSHW